MTQNLNPWKKRVFYGACLCIAFALLSRWWLARPSASSDFSSKATGRKTFHLSIAREPNHFDPGQLKGSEGGYIFPQLYATLFRWKENQLHPLVAKRACENPKPLVWRCELRTDFKWSDGKPLTAHDFQRSYLRVLQKQTDGTLAITLLDDVKDVVVRSANIIEFHLKKPIGDLQLRLASSALAAVPEQSQIGRVFSGAFKVAEHIPGRSLRLSPNATWPLTRADIDIEYVFVADDSTNLALYKAGQIDFLRRLPTALVDEYKDRADFHQIPMARFDYIGFGPRFHNDRAARAALALSMDYPQTRLLTKAPSQLGCPSLPERFFLRPNCLLLSLEDSLKAKAESKSLTQHPIRLEYSQQGGDDHGRFIQWMQSQWKKNLDLDVAIQSHENKYFLQRLRARKIDIFRKGTTLSRSTCFAALENFAPGRTENYIDFAQPEFPRILEELERINPESNRARELCQRGIQLLMRDFDFIPLGPVHFTILVRPEFTGWSLSELNELDLSELRPR